MDKLLLMVFGFIVLQGVFSFFQIRSYNNKLKEMKQYGMVGVGSKKGGINAGNITFLAIGKDGTIVRCEKMVGYTVFAKFREDKQLKGMNISELKGKLERNTKAGKNKKPDPLLLAIGGLEIRLSKLQSDTLQVQAIEG